MEPFCDAPPSETAPRAGGCVLKPSPPRRSDDDWECWLKLEKKGKHVTQGEDQPAKSAKTTIEGASFSTGGEEIEVALTGGCHCGKVRFSCRTANDCITIWDCNCSDCRLRRNSHFIVPRAKIRIEKGEENLAVYRWGSGQSIHKFCATCGISPFYVPRSNPDGVAITFACVDEASLKVKDVVVKQFDGNNWEKFIENEGKAIKSCSKDKGF
jgi:hypothetical protein